MKKLFSVMMIFLICSTILVTPAKAADDIWYYYNDHKAPVLPYEDIQDYPYVVLGSRSSGSYDLYLLDSPNFYYKDLRLYASTSSAVYAMHFQCTPSSYSYWDYLYTYCVQGTRSVIVGYLIWCNFDVFDSSGEVLLSASQSIPESAYIDGGSSGGSSGSGDDSGSSGGDSGSGDGSGTGDSSGTIFLTVSYETREEYLPGSTVQFYADFSSSGVDVTDRTVSWSVNGYSSNTTIDSSGLLTIGEDETLHTLTVTASSTTYGVSDTCDLTWGDDEDIPDETESGETVPDETVDATESLLEEIKQGVDDLNEGVAGLDEKVGDIDINTGFIQNDLESLVEGDEGSHAVSGGINESADGIDSDMSEVDGFQQEQMDILDDKYDEIEQSVDHGSFVQALQFVFKYTNMMYEGIADYAIVFTLPLYLGLFFFLCSRIPGNTGYKMHARKKGKK